MELTREYILRLQKNRQGTTGSGGGAAGTSGNYVTPSQLESALANKVDVSFFSRLFELYNGEGTTAAKIETNATLPEDTSKLNIKAPFDFWSQRSVSALGKGGSGSSSVFDEAAMWQALGGSIDNKQIALSHLTTALNGYVKGVKVGETTYNPNASGIVDLGTITGRTYAFATGATNGTFKVTPSVGDAYEVAIKGLGSLAYKSELTASDIPNLDATKITTGTLGVDRIPGLAASKIVSGTLDAARIPNLSWNKITTDKPTTLAGYGITDAKIADGVITLGANSITPLTDAKIKNDYTWWGQKLDASGKVTGLLSSVSGIKINSSGSGYGYIDFHYASASSFTSNIFEAQSGQLAINSLLYVKKGGYVGIGTNNPSTLLHVNGYTRTNRLYLQSASVYFELDSDGDVHLVGAGFYSDSFVSALGKGDSGSAFVLNEPLQSINTTFSANPSASQAGYAIVWNGSSWTYGKAASDGVDMNAVWTALNGSTGGKQINTAWLTGVTKKLTITSGNTTVVYDGTVARSITINDMAAKQLTASTIDGTAGSFFFYGDNLINNQYDWVGIQVDNANKDRGQLVWDSGSISVRQNDGDSWTDWALVLTNKNYASQIAAGTITNAMLAGSIANSKLANSSVTVNGTSVSLGGSITTSKWGESRNINIASSDGTGASTSVSVDGSAAKTLLLPSTIKASLTGNATSATKLNTGTATYSAWGQTYWSNGVPNGISGDMTSVGNITMSGHVKMDNYKHIEIKNTSGTYLNVLTFTSANQFVLGEGLQSYPTYLRGNTLTLQTGTSNAAALTINASGLVEVNQNTQGLKIGNAYLVWDSANNALKVTGANSAAVNFYATGGVSALGMGDSGGGGGVTLNEPLSSINTSSLGSPSGHTNSTMVWNGSSWVWSNSQGVSLGAYNFSAFAGNFNTLAINNKAVATQEWVTNNYVAHKEIGQDAATSYAGSFFFGGDSTLQANEDYVGFQAGNSNDRWQMIAGGGRLKWRQNDAASTAPNWNTGWGGWNIILDSGNTYISGQTITINGTNLTVPTGAGGDYLPLSGGTLTGILNLNFQSVNASETNNGISQAHVYPTTFNICDKYGKILTRMEADVESTGDISSFWYVRNYNTSGGQIGQKGIRMRLTKGGVFSYTVDEPDKFREAIGVNLGNYVAKTGDTMTGTLNINYNSGSAYALNVTGGFNLVSTTNSGILNAAELRLTAGYGIKMVGGANDVTVGDSSHANAVYSYGGFKKNGSSDSYVLLGGGGHKALSDFVQVYSNEISGNIYSVPCGTIFSGFDIADAPTTGWVSGIALGSNLNSNHYQSYLVESNNGNWYVTRSYQNGAMTNWKTLLDSNNYMQYTSAISNSADTGGGSAGWLRVAIIKFNGIYASQPIFMRIVQRGGYDGDLRIYFNNQNTTDPTLNNLTYTGTLKTVKLIRYTAGTWHLYVKKSENWDAISVSVRDMTPYMQAKVTVTYDNVFSSSEPTGTDFSNGSSGNWYAACEESFNNGDGTMKIYGVSSGYGDERIAIQTSFDGQDPKTSTYPSSYPTRACLLLQPRGGNVGIGTTSPAQKLDVNGNTRINGYLYILNSSVSTTSAAIRVAQVSGHTWLDVAGADGDYGIYNHGDFYCDGYGTFEGGYGSSDIRKKDIVKYVERSVEDIAKAPIFDFVWKQKPNKGTHLGTSAQYWQGILPNSVVTSPDGYLAMDYGAVALASAVSVARKVVDHELRIKQLQERVLELENELKQLKAA